MLFSFCKKQIWLELARETQNQTCLASGMPSRPSSPKFWAENRARRGSYAYFGDKYGYYGAFFFLQKANLVRTCMGNTMVQPVSILHIQMGLWPDI